MAATHTARGTAARQPEPGGRRTRPMGMKPDMHRVRTGAWCLLTPLIAAACASAVTACGSTPAASPSAARSGVAAKVSLDITVTTAPGAPSKHWTLRCDPPGGSHPDPAAACAVLLKAKSPFAPPAKGIMCPMIRVGTKTAIVKGTYFGRHVDTTFAPGGCQLAQWQEIGTIFN
jgi:Subtilisin inhibitor-like